MFIDYRQCRTRSEIYWDKKREGRVFIPSRSQNSPKPHRRVIFLRAGFHFQISSVFPSPPPPPTPTHPFLRLASDCGIISEWLDVIHYKLSLIILYHKYTFLVGPKVVAPTNGPNWTKVDQVTKVDQGGPMWVKVDQGGPRWAKVDQGGPRWTKMDQDGPRWTKVD